MKTKVKLYKPLLNDLVFKYIFGYNKNIVYTEYLLELLFNMNLGSLKGRIEIINSFKLEKTSYKERGLEVDVKVKMDDGNYLNLAAYTKFNMTSKLKSTMYLAQMFSTQLNVGEYLNETKPHLQINFVKGLNIKSRSFTILSEDEARESFIGEYFKIRVINVDEYKGNCYNEDDKLTKLLKFMSAESEEEELEIVRGDEILEKMYDSKQEFLQSEWASNFFTNINYMKSVHNAEIKEKDVTIEEQANTLKETVRNLSKQNFSIEEISNITKLNIETIQDMIREN